jgi:uncharacterized protein (DUF169 family)
MKVESKIKQVLGLAYSPVSIVWTDEKPENAKEFKENAWGCSMWLLASAAKGKTTVFSRKTYGCWGNGVGMGFGNQYLAFPGGIDGFCRFLSTGNANSEKGKAVAEQLKPHVTESFMEDFLHGEGYLVSPKLVEDFVESMPMMDVPTEFVVFKPLSMLDPDTETPEVVVLLATPDQLSALVILANYGRPGVENVAIPYAAGCQTIGIFPYREARSEHPRAIIGLTDISARKNLRQQLGKDLFTFSLPWKMFLELEDQVEGSFLEKSTWKELID